MEPHQNGWQAQLTPRHGATLFSPDGDNLTNNGKQKGATLTSVGAGHLTDALQYVLGDFTAFHSLLANQYPQITYINMEGLIEATGPFQFGDPTKITLKVGEKTEMFQVEGQDAESALGSPAANVARLYKAFAEGGELVNFDAAVERHKFLEELYNGQLGEKVIFSERV